MRQNIVPCHRRTELFVPTTALPARVSGRLNYWSAAALLVAGLCISAHASCVSAAEESAQWYVAPCSTASFHWDRKRSYNERHCGVGVTRREAQPEWYLPDAYSVDWLRKNSLGKDSVYLMATWEPKSLQLERGNWGAGAAVHVGLATGYHSAVTGAVLPGLHLRYRALRLDWTAWPDPSLLGAKKSPGEGEGSGMAIRLSIRLPL